MTNRHGPVRDETPSLGDLFAELTRESRTLIRQEIDLARSEMSMKARKAGRNAAYVGLGGAVAYAGLIAVVLAVGFLLGEIMPLWLAMLLAGLIAAGIGYALVQKGLKALKETDFSLTRTTETLQEDKQWLKNEVTS